MKNNFERKQTKLHYIMYSKADRKSTQLMIITLLESYDKVTGETTNINKNY